MITIGYVGLGAMGRPMAVNLAKSGQSMVVRDIDQTANDITLMQREYNIGRTFSVSLSWEL